MSDSPQVQIEPLPPSLPLTLCDTSFLKTLSEVEAQVTAVKIVDAQSAQHAANLQSRLTAAGKKLEDTRVELKRPFIAINKRIDDAAREPANRIERAKNVLRHGQIQWELDQRRIAAEAEAARQKELERLEAKRKAEAEETARKAAEIAKAAAEAAKNAAAPAFDVDFGDEELPAPPPKTATELEIDRVKFAPAPVVEKPTGIAIRVSLRHRVDAVSKLPDSFVVKTANDTAIRATFCNGYKDGEPLPVCPGVTFWVERTSVSTGKDKF